MLHMTLPEPPASAEQKKKGSEARRFTVCQLGRSLVGGFTQMGASSRLYSDFTAETTPTQERLQEFSRKSAAGILVAGLNTVHKTVLLGFSP